MQGQPNVTSARPTTVALDGCLAIEDLVEVAEGRARVDLSEQGIRQVERSRETLERVIAEDRPIYGVTTGFGALVSHEVAEDLRNEAQASLLRSHAAGVGAPLPRDVVRGAMALRLNGLAQGHSGIRVEPLRLIAALVNADLIPIVPRTGSLGASGDLAPSAHAFLPLIGEGQVTDSSGRQMDGGEALAELGLRPVELGLKEGLALINGTHFMAACGALLVHRFTRLAESADAIASLSLLGLGATVEPFDRRIHEVRPLTGQQRTAATVRRLLDGTSSNGPALVQDAYSLRCVPQVHGSAREALDFTRRMVEVDINAVTDNPLVFEEPDAVLSGGNFHGQSLSLAFDVARIALADLGVISERRTFRLLSPSTNRGLPPFLSSSAGASSGYMVSQYTAAALVGELRALAHPVSVDSIPTSDNQEDHVSFGMTGATMGLDAVERLANVLAVELLCACQALEFREAELSPDLATIHGRVREVVPRLEQDRPPADDIVRVCQLIELGAAVAPGPEGRNDEEGPGVEYPGDETECAADRDRQKGAL